MKIFTYLKKYWFFVMLAPVFMIGEVLMDLFQPKLMSKIVDIGLAEGDIAYIISTGLTMLGLVLIGGIFGVLSGVFTNLATFKYANDLRKDVFKHIMYLSFEQTDDFTTGSLVTRVTNDITQVSNIVSMSMRMFVRTLMQFAMGLVFLLKINDRFSIILLIALPLLLIIIIWFLVKVSPLFNIVQQKIDNVNAVVQENVTGSRVVKAYNAEYKEIKRFGKTNNELYDINMKVFNIMSIISPLMNICISGAMIGILYVGGKEIVNNFNNGTDGLKLGELTSAISYITIILNGFMMLAMTFQTIVRGMASIKRLNEVLKTNPIVKEGKITESINKGSIEFKDVSFTYPNSNGELVLNNINFSINKGEKIGILGSTGCGKSTLVNLITRFYDTLSGEVLVDGINVKDYTFETLRNKVVLVLQKSELYAGTIKENISWGKINATMDEIKEAAKIAQADDFIENFKDKYETLVTEKGTSLSGGQRQRVSIARAIIKKPEILIFDDSTSALDLKTEANLYQAINDNLKDMTIITIAQRVASVKNADKIIVLNEGEIASIGSHDELIKTSPIYIDIYNSQLKKEGER